MQHMNGDVITCAQTRRQAMARALCAVSVLSIGWSMPALAQDTPTQAQQAQQAYVDNGDIIVTARKRQESILKVPVVVSVVTDQKIENTGLTSVTELPKLVPGLVISGSLLSIGPQVTIRGVGTSSFDPGVDQSVSLNVDGLSLGQGLAFGSAMFDVGQVEVLKGPQALFYGKSSPGGVISLRTADPTDKFELIGRAGYEFVGREGRGELIASGPVTDSLLFRVATMYSKGSGYFINDAVPITSTGALAPTHRRNPQPKNFVIRGTMLFKPTESFSARLKVNHAYDYAENAELKQLSDCPEPGQAFTLGSGVAPGIPPAPNFLTPVDPIRETDQRGVYTGLPRQFTVIRYHSLVIEQATRPEVLEITATSQDDEIMGVRHRELAGTKTPLEGVQFHPESILTEHGHAMLRNFVELKP